nr:MAG TPA: hypothetical protein [Caudoviricetes sp.]
MEDDKRVRRIADIAEECGLRVWFSFAVCHIHRMYGPEIARFELDDQQRCWVSSDFLYAISGDHFREAVEHIGHLVDNKGSQSRGTLYAMKDSRVSWWAIKELEDGTGVKSVGAEGLDVLYTKTGVERVMKRYDVGRDCYIQEVDQSGMFGRRIGLSAKTGGDSDVPAGQNNPGGGNNNFFRSNF